MCLPQTSRLESYIIYLSQSVEGPISTSIISFGFALASVFLLDKTKKTAIKVVVGRDWGAFKNHNILSS